MIAIKSILSKFKGSIFSPEFDEGELITKYKKGDAVSIAISFLLTGSVCTQVSTTMVERSEDYLSTEVHEYENAFRVVINLDKGFCPSCTKVDIRFRQPLGYNHSSGMFCGVLAYDHEPLNPLFFRGGLRDELDVDFLELSKPVFIIGVVNKEFL